MYRVNEKTFATFSEACHYAKGVKAEVFQISNGLRRWAPAPPPCAAKLRRYEQRLAAYEASQRVAK